MSWGHPTTGVAQRCAPSLSIDPFLLIEGMRDLLRHGYVVVATDYVGMGAPGRNEYLVGVTAGRSVLDIARVARLLPDRGGRPAGALGTLAGRPRGPVRGTGGADVRTRAGPGGGRRRRTGHRPRRPAHRGHRRRVRGDHRLVRVRRLLGVYGEDLDSILTPAGAAATPAMARLCLLGQNAELHRIATPLIGGYVRADPASTEPWATLLEDNTPGAERLEVPLFVAQGQTDTLVRPRADRPVRREAARPGHRGALRPDPGDGPRAGRPARPADAAPVAGVGRRGTRLTTRPRTARPGQGCVPDSCRERAAQ